MEVDSSPRFTGTQINYLLVCPRKLWLFSHDIEMERESDTVALGRLLHEESFERKKKEILIDDLIRLDFFDDDAVHDIKKGRSMEIELTPDAAQQVEQWIEQTREVDNSGKEVEDKARDMAPDKISLVSACAS